MQLKSHHKTTIASLSIFVLEAQPNRAHFPFFLSLSAVEIVFNTQKDLAQFNFTQNCIHMQIKLWTERGPQKSCYL